MGIKLPKFEDVISPRNRRFVLIFAFFLIALSVFYILSKNSAPEFAASEPERKASLNKNDPDRKASAGHDRILKLHLLQRMKEAPNPNLNKESRNIFLASRESSGGQSNPQAGSPQEGQRTPQLVIPPFPYKIIGKVRFLKPGGPEEYAVIFNGFGNTFVKEGEMIDPNYKLIKLYENDADVQYAGLAEIIKVEIKGR